MDKAKLTPKTLIWTVFIWAIVAILAFPLFWMLSTAFKPASEVFARPPTLFSSHPTLDNFARVFAETRFTTYFLNSVIVSVSTTALVLVVSTLGAYAMSSFRLRGTVLIGRSILLAYMLPSTAILIPVYLMVARMGLTNTMPGLIIAYTSLNLPFSLWMMRAFMASIPREIEAAAMIDGASRMGAFFDVVLPQALPGIITTGVFTFILSWNEYLFALVMVNNDSQRTLSTGVMGSLISGYSIEWGMVMAAATLMALPLLLIFLFLQRYVVQGFGAGSVKG